MGGWLALVSCTALCCAVIESIVLCYAFPCCAVLHCAVLRAYTNTRKNEHAFLKGHRWGGSLSPRTYMSCMLCRPAGRPAHPNSKYSLGLRWCRPSSSWPYRGRLALGLLRHNRATNTPSSVGKVDERTVVCRFDLIPLLWDPPLVQTDLGEGSGGQDRVRGAPVRLLLDSV